MTPGRSQWLLRSVVVLSIAVFITVLFRAGFVRGFTLRLLGIGERPLVVLSDTIDETGAVVFASRKELVESVVSLEERIARVASVAAEREQAERERDDALALLAYDQEVEAASIQAARVLLRFDEDGSTVLIDQGSEEGVVQGQAVILGEGVFFGVVDTIYPHTAVVRSVTHHQSSIGATLLGAAETQGVVQGGFGSLVQMRFIPQEIQLEKDQLVVTSGADPRIPRGLIIGTIESSGTDSAVPFQHAFIEPLQPIQYAQIVGLYRVTDGGL